jgi:hypothetical protein
MLLSSRPTSSKCDDCNQKLLDEQLDWLTVDHDDLRQDLLEQMATPKYHPSMAIIDNWEEETIARIRHTAVLARRALIDALDEHVLEVKNTLNTLTPKLRDARHGRKPFNENDLQEWATVLHQLKQIPVLPVIADKKNKIYGLTIDLRREKHTHHSVSNRHESTLRSLVSVLHDLNASASTSNTTEYQLASSNSSKKTDRDNKKVDVGNTFSNGSQTITPGGVVIIREPPKNETTSIPTHVRRAYAEIPFDSNTSYPLRGPATVYH